MLAQFLLEKVKAIYCKLIYNLININNVYY